MNSATTGLTEQRIDSTSLSLRGMVSCNQILVELAGRKNHLTVSVRYTVCLFTADERFRLGLGLGLALWLGLGFDDLR